MSRSRPRWAYRLGWRSIRYVCPHLSRDEARHIADALGPAFARYEITTRRRAAAAVAQLAHESAGFSTTTEFASGSAYEWRRDLGNTRAGDGRKFKGRGYLQITGRGNYGQVSRALKHNFLAFPHDLAKPQWAAQASCWWWHEHGCNRLADRRDFEGLTRRINGGLTGYPDRVRLYRRARRVSRFLVPKRRRPT